MKNKITNRGLLHPFLFILIVLLVSIVPYFWGLGKADIQDVDEAAYAEIAREIVASGDWISPTLNGNPFDQHPPLAVWIMAASEKLLGATPLAVRLPNAILALFGLLLTYLIGKRMADRETGIAAALALATAPAYHLMVRDARLDMALMVFITLSLWGVIGYLYEEKRYYLVIGYIGAALAFLTKGPIGLVIPLFVVGVFIIMTRRWRLILKLGLHWGLLIIAAVLLPWYWAMYKAHGGQYLYVLFIVQNFKRFATTNYTGKSDPFFFVHTFLWMFLPWAVAIFWKMVQDFPSLWRARFDLNKISPESPAPGLVTIWLIAPIVLMSFSKSKLPQYIFFVLPAAAVIAGRFLRGYLDYGLTERGKQGFSIYVFILSALLIGVVAFIATVMFPLETTMGYAVLGNALFGLFGLGLFFLIMKNRPALVAVLALVVGVVHLFIVLFLSPAMLTYQPYKGFAADLKAAGAPAGDVYFVGKNYKSSFLFYNGGHAVVPETDLKALDEATTNGKTIHMIAPAEMIPKLEAAGFTVEVISTRDYYHTSLPTKKFLFLKTRPKAVTPMILGVVSRADEKEE